MFATDDVEEEDALSTITEITEPDHGGIFNSNRSLHSSSSSVATKASGEELEDDNFKLDTTLQGEDSFA